MDKTVRCHDMLCNWCGLRFPSLCEALPYSSGIVSPSVNALCTVYVVTLADGFISYPWWHQSPPCWTPPVSGSRQSGYGTAQRCRLVCRSASRLWCNSRQHPACLLPWIGRFPPLAVPWGPNTHTKNKGRQVTRHHGLGEVTRRWKPVKTYPNNDWCCGVAGAGTSLTFSLSLPLIFKTQ